LPYPPACNYNFYHNRADCHQKLFAAIWQIPPHPHYNGLKYLPYNRALGGGVSHRPPPLPPYLGGGVRGSKSDPPT